MQCTKMFCNKTDGFRNINPSMACNILSIFISTDDTSNLCSNMDKKSIEYTINYEIHNISEYLFMTIII